MSSMIEIQKRRGLVLLGLIMALAFFTACADAGPTATATVKEPVETSEPEATATREIVLSGTEAALSGIVISTAGILDKPLADTEVHLAKVYWDENSENGTFLIDETTSPVTVTDDAGVFVFAQVEARDYVIVVGDLYGKNMIISNPDGTAVVYTAEPGRQLDVGELKVDLDSAPALVPASPEAYPPSLPYPEP